MKSKKDIKVEKICDIWCEILNEDINKDDNLLEKGLESLNATKVISILNQRYAITIKLKSVFLFVTPIDFVEKCLNKIELNDDDIFEGEI